MLVADTEKAKSEFLLRNASELLEAHGFSDIELMDSSQEIEEAATEELLASVDLVVAGIHSRKFWKDIFVGSFTKELLKRRDKPLFLSN